MITIALVVLAFILGAIAGRKYSNVQVEAVLKNAEAKATAEVKVLIADVRAKV